MDRLSSWMSALTGLSNGPAAALAKEWTTFARRQSERLPALGSAWLQGEGLKSALLELIEAAQQLKASGHTAKLAELEARVAALEAALKKERAP